MTNKLGEVFVHKGLITEAQLEMALKAQLIYGGHLGTCFIELSMLDEETLGQTLSEITGFPYAPSNVLNDISEGTIRCLSAKIAEEYQAIPLRLTSKVLHVAMVEPRNLRAIDELSFASGYRVEPWISPELRVFQALEKYYGVPRRLRYIALCRALDSQPPGKTLPPAQGQGTGAVSNPAQLPNPQTTPPLAIGEPPAAAASPSPPADPGVLETEATYGYGKSWREIADELDTQSQPAPKKEESPVGASSAPPPTDRRKSKKNRKEKHRHATPSSPQAAAPGQAAVSGHAGPAAASSGSPGTVRPGSPAPASGAPGASSTSSSQAGASSAGHPAAASAPGAPKPNGSPAAANRAAAPGPAAGAAAIPGTGTHAPGSAVAIPVSERLCRADTTRDIIAAILDETARTTDRTLFFAINNETLSLWDARGGPWKPEARPRGKFSVTSEPLFGLLLGESHFRGVLPDGGSYGSFYQSLGLSVPREILLLPLYLNDRLVGIFYGDTQASGKAMAPTEEYLKLMRLVSYSLNMVLLKQKIRTAAQSREAAGSPSAEVESKQPSTGL